MPSPSKAISTLRLRNKTALITGATRGIGRAIAKALAEEGCNLILTARDENDLRKVRREVVSEKIFACPCDIRDPHSVDDLFRAIRQEFRQLDIVINNAGTAHANLTVDKLPYAVWRDIFATNVDGTFLITQASLGMMKRGATIVNNLSIAATRVFPGTSAYNASKHAALGFTNTLREELRSKGIRVIGLLPGATDTDIWKTLWPGAPRKKMMSPETVAKAVVGAILLPPNTTVESLEILPTVGTL